VLSRIDGRLRAALRFLRVMGYATPAAVAIVATGLVAHDAGLVFFAVGGFGLSIGIVALWLSALGARRTRQLAPRRRRLLIGACVVAWVAWITCTAIGARTNHATLWAALGALPPTVVGLAALDMVLSGSGHL